MISKNQIKFIKSLHNKKNREEEKLFIVEGIKSVCDLLITKPNIIKYLYATENFIIENADKLKNVEITAEVVKKSELEHISGLSSANETLAVCKYFEDNSVTVNFKSQISFYLDNIRDPGNLGTIMRICSWFGIPDLFCSPGTVELYNSKCIQASMGAFLRVNVHYLPITELITTNKIDLVYATLLKGDSIYKEKITGGLIVIGNEANGISEEVIKVCNKQITIPSADLSTESLNAAIASSIIASEYFRNKF